MDRQAFKQRMQNLKSYRENNPGKGYWDWKVEAFADGGVNDNLIGSYSNHTGTPTMYVPVTKEYEAVPEGFGEIANVHTPEVTITPQSNISLVEAVDKGRRGAAPYVGAIVAGATLPAMSSTNMLGKAIDLANIVLDPTNPVNYVKIPNIRLGRWSAKFPEYGNQNKAFRQVNVDAVDDYINTGVVGPESKAHNAMRSAQNANKNSEGGSKRLLTLLTKHFDTHVMFNKTKPFYGKDSKYPRVLVGDLRNPRINWKKVNHKGHKNIVEPVDPSAGNFTVPIEEFDIWRKAKIGWLRDQKANRFADGGQTGDHEKERFYQATGRSSSGRPLEEGLKPVFSLEDAANMTPIGDAISARDTYNAVKNRDWLGAGLAAATMIPFVPMTVKQFRSKYKGITPKNSFGANSKLLDQQVQRQIDALATEKARREAIINQSTKLTSQANNEGYRIIERLMDDPSYLERAREVKRNFGDNYTRIYSDLIQDYNTNPNNIPKAILDSGISGRAKMRAKGNAQTRVDKGGTPPGRGEFEYAIDPLSTDLTGDVTLHELNHYTDFIKNKSPHADANSNLFYQMSKDMDGVKVDDHDSYFSLPTEQKAYMNQLREYLFNSGKINRRNDKVSLSTIKQALTDIQNKPEYDSTIRASKQFKSLRGYTKWFNTIPLLGTTALGTNTYFNNNKNE